MENSLKVAIIILNWNGLKDTLECLESLKKTAYPNYRIFLVDNGSKGDNAEILEKESANWPNGRIQLIKNKKNFGFAEGNNIAIREVLKDEEVKYVFLLNNDTTVEPDFLTEVVSVIQNSKFKILPPKPAYRTGRRDPAEAGATFNSVGMVAIRMMNYYRPDEVDSLGVRFTRGGLAFNIKSLPTEQAGLTPNASRRSGTPPRRWQRPILFCPCGGAALYSRELLEKIAPDKNYFDPDFFCYAEDLDLGFRGRLAGFDCVLADKSIVYHKGSASTSKMSDFAVYHTYRNIIWAIAKNLPLPLFLKYLPKLIFGQKLIILLYFFRRKPGLILKAYFNAFQKLPKMLKKRQKIQNEKTVTNKSLDQSIIPTWK